MAWPESAQGAKTNPAFFLLSDSQMFACAKPREILAGGDWSFIENREGPPSRAYLKLWEWGWRTEKIPTCGETALDLGASPGGWTWVLAKAGLKVHAYDRSPLELKLPPKISSLIQFSKGDAFQVTPENAPPTDWVFCDVIAEPQRTIELIEAWLPTEAGLVFTIKFKGETDFKAIDHLAKIDGAVIRHLNVNKHEVTFWRLPGDSKV
jgi:23S rRNA (cytidine2498-2'-O)-methyltransferase